MPRRATLAARTFVAVALPITVAVAGWAALALLVWWVSSVT